MHALHTFLLLHVLTCLGQTACASDIIDGEKAAEGSLLYMASVQNSKNKHVCGGFLIRDNFVVTAAHCDSRDLSHVILGTHDLKANDGKKHSIEKKYKYPRYKNAEDGDDIMLLKLRKNVTLDNRVKTIPIPRSEENIKDGTQCQVAGWGSSSSDGVNVDELRVVDVSILNTRSCDKLWGGDLPVNVICTGGIKTTKRFSQGYSGGPLVCNRKAVGVVSINKKKNSSDSNLPNVYTDISQYLIWIKKYIGKP